MPYLHLTRFVIVFSALSVSILFFLRRPRKSFASDVSSKNIFTFESILISHSSIGPSVARQIYPHIPASSSHSDHILVPCCSFIVLEAAYPQQSTTLVEKSPVRNPLNSILIHEILATTYQNPCSCSLAIRILNTDQDLSLFYRP